MRYSSFTFLAAAFGLTAAAPLAKRAALSANDITVLQLALYAEYLESDFYSGACNKYTDADFTAAGFPTGYRDSVCVVAGHEMTHATTIASTLTAAGVTPNPPCNYSFPYTSPTTFVQLANLIEPVGIGAYIGGAGLLVDSPALLEVAASILTVEARHDAFFRFGLGASPFPAPFDTALSAVWAFNIAELFVTYCPVYQPFIDLPKLTYTGPTPPTDLRPALAVGTELSFSWDPTKFFVPVAKDEKLYIAMVNQIGTPIFEEVTMTGAASGTVPVPSGVAGSVFVCLTTFSGGLTLTDLTNYGTLAGPMEILIS